MKKFKKVLVTLALGVLAACTAFTFAACSTTPDSSDEDNTTYDVVISDTALKDVVGDGAIYVTSIGQADYSTATLLAKAAVGEGNYTADNKLAADAVADGDTVVIVIGMSSKGLGGAGTDQASEEARANAFAAKKDSINIIALHLGGEERRGTTSDPSIRTIAQAAKLVMVVKGGNNDGLFNTLCGETIPLYFYTKATNMQSSLRFVLGGK